MRRLEPAELRAKPFIFRPEDACPYYPTGEKGSVTDITRGCEVGRYFRYSRNP